MPDNCWRAISTRETHIGFRYSFFFQICNRNILFKHFLGFLLKVTWKNPTLPIFWLSAYSSFIWFNSSVTSLLFPRKNSSDFLAPSRSPLETRKIGDLGIQNIQSPRSAGKMIQIPEKRRQSVSQFKLSKKTPKKTINCMHEPKAPRYLQTTAEKK